MRKLSAVFAGMLAMLTLPGGAATKQPIPAPTHDVALATTHGRQTAVFAGGCFWGTQAVFQRLKGVLHTTAGYSGGTKETANYGQVAMETTDHAESVEVVYDPARITYGTLLRIFFSVAHDPTQLNRQDNDIGYSYRSAIFYANEEQRKLATDYIAQLDAAHVLHGKIVTKLSPLQAFYPGEDYHQDYALKNPGNPYIQVCDLPKIAALKKQFPDLFVEYNGHYQQ
jgi:peptide-methionine (S)-S-oxide reductase